MIPSLKHPSGNRRKFSTNFHSRGKKQYGGKVDVGEGLYDKTALGRSVGKLKYESPKITILEKGYYDPALQK